MTDDANQTTKTQRLLDRLAAGDEAAIDELIDYAMDRLRRLASWKLDDFQKVRRWEVTDDVLQNSLLKLRTTLKKVKPTSKRHFINLAGRQINHELVDLYRHHYGPEGGGKNHYTEGNVAQGDMEQVPRYEQGEDIATGPLTAMQFVEFHERVNDLPEEEQEVFSKTSRTAGSTP